MTWQTVSKHEDGHTALIVFQHFFANVIDIQISSLSLPRWLSGHFSADVAYNLPISCCVSSNVPRVRDTVM